VNKQIDVDRLKYINRRFSGENWGYPYILGWSAEL